jgi:glycyl-tRNA synthetase
VSERLSFQDIIIRLLRYWADWGCIVWQPYYVQVGAGTMNPATALRVLGPEPWNVVYIEPSVRPDDGRYAENPNRMQLHYQLQVILKPDPGNPQELYLNSLAAIGIDMRQHDIRFVEDNWESPALGAWGLGWEVWLDGQEITQYTYFQQSGSQDLDPVAVELTYGLERITLALQGVDAVWDLEWGHGLTYGQALKRSEWEHCVYYFEKADVDALRQVYDTYEREAKRALSDGLVMPAHDYVLKCSHLFNVLDTRGAIGVTQRAEYFGRMRDLSRQVAEAFIGQRQMMEYPIMHTLVRPGSAAPTKVEMGEMPTAPAPYLLEIGSEELPAADLSEALAQLRELAPAMLDEARLDYRSLRVLGTPRRLVVHVQGLAPHQRAEERIMRGPPVRAAYDADGNPTKAAEGFARGQGVPVEALERREMDGGEYVVAVVRDEGRPSAAVLSEKLPELIASLRFGKSMRWNETGIGFSRPIRWLVSLYGGAIVPFEYAGVVAGRTTRGTRPTGSPPVDVGDAPDYFRKIKRRGVLIDPDERRRAGSRSRRPDSRRPRPAGGSHQSGRAADRAARLV